MHPLLLPPTRAASTLALALLVGACATPMTPAPAGDARPTAPAPSTEPTPAPKPAAPLPLPPAATPLTTEQRFFESRFAGTPVVISAQAPSALQIEVPLQFAFDTAKADVKPPLAKVLEYVAESLRRQAGARLVIAAPPDSASPPALATTRGQRIREVLVTHRIAATRIVIADPPARAGTPVQLRLALPAPPIAKVDDSQLPVPTNAVKPVAATRATITEKR